MSDQTTKTPIVEPKPTTTPEPVKVTPVDAPKAPLAEVEPAKAV